MSASSIQARPFRWQDAGRVVQFGRGALADAPELLGEGYTLLTTERARGAAPALVERAASVHQVPPGRVDEIAAALRGDVEGDLLVALGGGRVIDTAKALAAADPPRSVAAVPTTLSAAEMTWLHRHAAGVPAETSHVRPQIVLNDPELSASAPAPALAASALNALSHTAEATMTTTANAIATAVALAGARLLVTGFEGDDPDRDSLALGALLAGFAADAAGYGLHHVMAQTLARYTAVGHAAANGILLPHTLRALARRFPIEMERFGEAIGEDPPSAAARLTERIGTVRLRELGVTPEELATCADAALERPQLGLTPPPPDRAELLAIYETAW
ncbi:MAG: maleylacetate reductase [Solirubrobacteraceae bacterium]|jgi:alcohol dehydrogenase class IV|nr:maleylacetate reductase [Solirubrobacteraceae bacterium]